MFFRRLKPGLTRDKAITWAALICEVDIISMSFGFPREVPEIGVAIRTVELQRNDFILFFAAASAQQHCAFFNMSLHILRCKPSQPNMCVFHLSQCQSGYTKYALYPNKLIPCLASSNTAQHEESFCHFRRKCPSNDASDRRRSLVFRVVGNP